jgi:Mg-chelatase subunit ChlD
VKNPLRSPKPFILLCIRYLSIFTIFPISLINPNFYQITPAKTKQRLVFEVGHWQNDSGATCGSTREVDINLAVATKAAEILSRDGHNVEVLPGTALAVHNYSADAFVALHVDQCAPGHSGFKVARWKGLAGTGLDGSGDASDTLVTEIIDAYKISTGLDLDTEPGVYGPCMLTYYALNPIDWGRICIGNPTADAENWTQMRGISDNTPGVIIEMGWLSGDLAFITSEDGQEKMAQGIVNGILNFLSHGSSSSITDTMLVIDVSGSMNDVTQEGRKIDAARSAATNIVNMIKQDYQSSSGTTNHRAGLVTFTTDAYLNHALSSDFDLLLTTIAGITPLQNTNIGAGLEVANQSLAQASPQAQKIIILLSDGMSNTGLSGDGIIAGPVQDAINAGTCIYTVGFGNPGNLDEDLLRRIADASGCGDYYPAASVSQLEYLYTRIRHVSTGNLLAEFSGTVSQGETVQAGEFDVPAGLGELAASLVWPGSMLDLQLIDPSGTLVDMNYPSTNINSYSKLIYALIQNPKAGTWRLGVYGRDIPQVTTSFNALVSGRGNAAVVPSPTFSTGPVIVLVLLTIAGGGVAVYSTKLRRRKKGSAHPITRTVGDVRQLVFSQGALAGRSITIPENGLIIGRSSGCSLKIPDPAVSRKHARLVIANGEWFIQDLGSSGGTYVNGQRVTAAPVKPGDVIQIGTNIFVVR